MDIASNKEANHAKLRQCSTQMTKPYSPCSTGKLSTMQRPVQQQMDVNEPSMHRSRNTVQRERFKPLFQPCVV